MDQGREARKWGRAVVIYTVGFFAVFVLWHEIAALSA
jgi:hypothetical protein